MKIYLMAFVSIVLTFGTVQAQSPDRSGPDNTVIEQVDISDARRPAAGPDAALVSGEPQQSGTHVSMLLGLLRNSESGQFAGIYQQGTAQSAQIEQLGYNNLAVMYQYGSANVGQLSQDGTGNRTGLLQHGYDNLFDVDITGSNNYLGVVQVGNGLEYLPDINDSNRHVFRVQMGIGNQVVELGQGGVPVNIEQRGEGMELIIQHH